MIPFVKKYLLDNWQSLNLGEKPEDLLFIKFAERRIRAPEVGIISFLVKGVYQKKEKALLILRFPRYANNPEANLSLKMEYQNLCTVCEKQKKKELSSVIPKPVLWQEINSSPVLAISFLPGKKLSQNMLSKNISRSYVENFGLAFAWLVEFQKSLRPTTSSSLGDIVEKTILEYKQSFPQEASKREAYFSRLREITGDCGNLTIPIFAHHGDYHAENIFVVDKKISGVIDWEDFEWQGVPGFDLFHFIKTYFEALFAYFVKRKDLSSLERFSSNKEVLGVVQATIENYCQAIGIDSQSTKILVPLYLFHSACLAGCARKKAIPALKKIEILLGLEPFCLKDLFLYMTAINYGDLYKKAFVEKDQKLTDLCRDKIQGIQEISNRASQKSG